MIGTLNIFGHFTEKNTLAHIHMNDQCSLIRAFAVSDTPEYHDCPKYFDTF